MKKLNNQGWGLNVMLTFMFVFFIAIFLVAYLSNINGLGPTTSKTTDDDSNAEYKSYESIIKNEAIAYQEEKYPFISNGDSFYVNIENLSSNDEILKSCSGYVEFGKENNAYYYNPYLKCGSYETTGYISSLDK